MPGVLEKTMKSKCSWSRVSKEMRSKKEMGEGKPGHVGRGSLQ